MRIHKPLRIVFGLLVSSSMACAQTYVLHTLVLSSGGGYSSSTSYDLGLTVGEFVTGRDSSPSYKAGFGFWNQVQGIEQYYTGMYTVADGWNMISVPRTVSDYRKVQLYPTTISNAFAFAQNVGYVPRDTLANKAGYWLKFDSNAVVTVTGAPRTMDTIPVTSGWNMIGSIGSAVDTAMIV